MTLGTAGLHADKTRAVRVEVSHAPVLNFAMEQAGVPVITGVRIENIGSATLEGLGLVVRIDPNLVEPHRHPIGRLSPGEALDLSALDLQVRPGRLRGVTEAERAELAWELRDAEGVCDSGRSGLEVLAYNEWSGLRTPPALLATFVTPNDPALGAVLRRVRDRLRETTGDGAITGYQTRSSQRVREMVAALYETVQRLGVSYIGAPASFESVGQKVRWIQTVLEESHGNCLDLSVLVASCLEQMGISPLIVVLRGHAFPGAWLVDDRFHEGVVYDSARLRNVAALGHVLFFDSSAMVKDPRVDLDTAEQIAKHALAKDAEILCAVDVAVARRDRYRPMSLREPIERSSMPPTGATEVTAEASERDSAPAERDTGSDPRRRAGEEPAPPTPVAERFRKWRESLLDLSLRNKLLNFRRDARGALPLHVPDVAHFEDLLSADQSFTIDPRPADVRDQRNTALVRAHGGDQMRLEALRRDLDKGILHCPLDETALRKSAFHLEKEARLAIEEGGANVLYVAIGILKWFEADDSTLERWAPLLLVPVALEMERTKRRVTLRRLAEDSLPNSTLIEKMNADFHVDLSSLASVEPDDSGLDVKGMLRGVREAIQRMPRWEVLEEAHLGLFSFTKYLMWRDLVENAEILLENPVVHHIATKKTERLHPPGTTVPPGRLDDEVPPGQVPLVIDADASQTAAIVSALGGRSFVLQGPPGTGKSQTITNLIAAALAAGKTVLFVSEKMAALEVVQRRLKSVGLEDFCLELHSHKAQKSQVIQSLGRTFERDERVRAPAWDEAAAQLARLRTDLNAYTRALHAPTALGQTFHQASARSVALAHAPLLALPLKNAAAFARTDLHRALEMAASFGKLAGQVEPVAQHPFRDALVDGWSAQHDQEAREALGQTTRALHAAVQAKVNLCEALHLTLALGPTRLAEMARVARTVSGGPVPAAWREDATWLALRTRATALTEATASWERCRSELARRWSPELLSLDVTPFEALFTRWANAFVLFAWFFLFAARRRLTRFTVVALPPNRQIATDLRRVREASERAAAIADLTEQLRASLQGCGETTTAADREAILARGDALRSARRNMRSGPSSELEALVSLADPSCADRERAKVAASAEGVLSTVAAVTTATDRLRAAMRLRDDSLPADAEGYFEKWQTMAARWADQIEAYRPWCLYRRARRDLATAGYEALAEAHATGALRGVDCEQALERSLLEAWLAAMRDASPVLRDFDGQSHHALVDRFRGADRGFIRQACGHVVSKLESRLPSSTDNTSASSEPGILKRELAKKTRHKPLRKLLQEIPNLLVRLKPCLLMSPLSVAQYLPARGRKFGSPPGLMEGRAVGRGAFAA